MLCIPSVHPLFARRAGSTQTYAQGGALALLPARSLAADGCCSGLVGRWKEPSREIVIGNSRGCRGLPVPSALHFPQHLSLLQLRFCLQREALGHAAGLAWGQLSSAVSQAVPARIAARRLAALPGHGLEPALEGPGWADIWELRLGHGSA